LNAPPASGDKHMPDQTELEQGADMKIERRLHQSILGIAILAAFSFCGALNASAADTYVYKDIRKPNGYPRDTATKQSDFAACGIPVEGVSAREFPKFNACLRARGWALDHIMRDSSDGPSQDRPGEGIYTYNDINGRARGNDQEQAATTACDGGNTRNIGTSAFNACMRSHGWRFTHFAPKAHDDDQDKRNEDASNDAERQRDDQMRNDDFIRNLNSQP
jgi:hypothetical protein